MLHRRLLSKFARFILLFSLWSIFFQLNTSTTEAQNVKPCSTLFNNVLDASCRCAPNQCRLSIIDDPNFNATTDSAQSTTINPGQYVCYDGVESVNNNSPRLGGPGASYPDQDQDRKSLI